MTKKIYLVTDGDYSSYRVLGAFTTREAAETFRLFHHLDSVEEFDLDPETPAHSGLAFECCRPLANGSLADCDRVSNELHKTSDLRIIWYEGSWFMPVEAEKPGAKPHLEMTVLADDEQHALKIFMEKTRAFKAGSIWASYFPRGSAVPTARYMMLDGWLNAIPLDLPVPSASP